MKWFYVITLILVLALGLLPFYAITPPDTSFLQGPPGKQPSVLYDSLPEKIKSLDPATCGDTLSAGLQGQVFEGLYGYHFLKRPIELIPKLAAALPTISEDKLTYTIPLRRGVRYHRNPCFGVHPDGTPRTREMKAADCVLAFKRIADSHMTEELAFAFIEDKIRGVPEYRARTHSYPKGDFSRYDKEDIAGVRAVDDYTLEIRLTAPFPQLLHVLAMSNYAPIPREMISYYLARPPLDKRTAEIYPKDFRACVGTGPYYIHDYVDGGRIVLCRNEEFRDDFYPAEGTAEDRAAGLLADAGKKIPFIDVLYFDYVPEENPLWMLFMTKQSDTVGIPAGIYSQVISPSRELTEQFSRQGIRLLKYSQPALYFFTFNMEDRVVGASKSLRQAMSLGYDAEDFIRKLRNGRGKRPINIIPTGLDGHDEAGPCPYARFDPAAAREKLKDAQKELAAAGVIRPGEPIPPLTLDMGGTDETTRRWAEDTKKKFADLGIEMKIEMQDWPTLLAKMNRKQTQFQLSGWHADYPDTENFLQLFYSPNIKRGTNNSNYSNPAYDKLYEQIAVMPPSPQRTELCVRMIRMISEDCPVLLQDEPVAYLLTQPWLYNVKPHPIAYGNQKYWRIDVAARQKAGGR